MKKLFILLVSFAAILPLTSQARIRDVGNGGDVVVLEFMSLAHQVAQDIDGEAGYLFPEFTAEQLVDAIETTTVVSKDKTVLNGIEKDAINYPTRKLIEVNRSRWDVSRFTPEKIRSLVLHEYLGIMGLNDADFKISERLIDYYISEKPRFEATELLGRLMFSSSLAPDSGIIELQKGGKIHLQASLSGKTLECDGTYAFDYNTQIVQAALSCGNAALHLELNFWNSQFHYAIKKAMFDLKLQAELTENNSSSVLLNQNVEAKFLR